MENTQKTPEELKKEEQLAKRRERDAKKRAEDKARKEAEAARKEAELGRVEAVMEDNEKKDASKEAEDAARKELEDIKKGKDKKDKVVYTAELKTPLGKVVKNEDYFFKGVVPAGFDMTCGKPVDREDLISLFYKVFKEKDDILFYRQLDKEVYLVIIPLKYATEVGSSEDSIEGDFQKHAISFLTEGSVNLDTMKIKLERIKSFVKYDDR